MEEVVLADGTVCNILVEMTNVYSVVHPTLGNRVVRKKDKTLVLSKKEELSGIFGG